MEIIELNHFERLVIRLNDKRFAVQVRVKALQMRRQLQEVHTLCWRTWIMCQ